MFAIQVGLVCLLIATATNLSAQDLFAQALPKTHTIAMRSGAGSYLGVGVNEVTEERAKALNMKDAHGVEVKHVDENSPAAKAGLKETDVILDLNGQRVEGVEQFIRIIGETPAGRKLNIAVWRNGSNQTLTAMVDSRGKNGNMVFLRAPSPPAAPLAPGEPQGLGRMTNFTFFATNTSRLGIEVETLTPQLADFFGAKQGVLVRTVNAKTPAEKAGMKAGDVIAKVAGTAILGPREIAGAIRNAKGKVSIVIIRNKKEMTLDLDVPEAKLDMPARAEVLE